MSTQPINARLRGLWQHVDFVKVWSAHTVSQFGSQITLLALPLTAALTLHATPGQMGVLLAAGYLPNLLLGLPAGAWMDRRPKRPVMILTDLVRALLLLGVPALALWGQLSIGALYLIAFLVGLATLFFDLAAQAYLPALIGREHLLDGNAKLEASRSAATAAGPGLAGVLTQAVSAPLAMLGNALTFVASALFLVGLHHPEPQLAGARRRLGADILEGMRTVWESDVLRATFRTGALWNFSVNVIQAVLILFATRSLHLSPGLLGVALSMMGVGMLVGAALAGPWRRRLGAGPALIAAGFLASSGGVLLALSGVFGGIAGVLLLMVGQFVYGLGPMIFGINSVTLRQAVTPDRLQARVAATFRFVVWGALPLGALAGGAIGSAFGLPVALIVGAVGMVGSVSLLLFSSLPTLREPSLPPENIGEGSL
ncbi:MFS transporter [Deinococcus altitudinis]|uniref:MFS transporter n=1 Tax=Deinococcus altitudinis TaxID=468914 RepID=UPI003891CF4D